MKKEKYIKPTTGCNTIYMQSLLMELSGGETGITEASPEDGPVVTDPTAAEGEAWGDAKQWSWDFND